MDLNNKVTVIIGGSQGFGKSLAKFFIKENAKVIIISKNINSANNTAKEIGAIGYAVDIRNEQDLINTTKLIVNKFGNIDIWINGAGIFMKFPNNEKLDMDRAHELFDVNFFGTVIGSQTAIKYMKNNGGTIVNILSSAALDPTRAIGASLYASSKWAVRGYTDALRSEYIDSNIKIISLYPGGMKTHLHDESIPTNFADFMDPDYVSEKVINNLKLDKPQDEQIIKRPNV